MAGRPPDIGEKRSGYLRVRLGELEETHLDHACALDSLSRSDYVRGLLHADFREKGLMT